MRSWLFAPVNSGGLAAYRVIFALLNFVGLARFWSMGWIDRFFLEPQFHFKYYGFSWVNLWPGEWIYIHFAALLAVCLLLALGLFTRIMSVLFFLGFAYIELLDSSNYLNHYYLITLLGFIGIFLPLNARWSLDNFFGVTQRRALVPAWTLNVLRVQVGTVYFFAGLAKLGGDWLLHAEPMNIWLTSHAHMPVLGFWFGQVWVQYAMSWTGFLFDLTIPFWLSWSRSRPYAYFVVVAFHTMTFLLFPIGMFPFIMIFSALVFFPANWPQRLWLGLRMCGVEIRPLRESAGPILAPSRVVTASLALFFLVQWTLPFRHFAYPGNVLWNEEGMRFSWKVMIREKNSSVEFRIEDRASKRVWYISPSEYLRRHQIAEMSGTPDMILQFAHFLQNRFGEEGWDVAVYADVLTSFNGRPSQLLIDPQVDLTQFKDSLWPKTWILPEPTGAPLGLVRRSVAQ